MQNCTAAILIGLRETKTAELARTKKMLKLSPDPFPWVWTKLNADGPMRRGQMHGWHMVELKIDGWQKLNVDSWIENWTLTVELEIGNWWLVKTAEVELNTDTVELETDG